jgi:hypothetical protein
VYVKIAAVPVKVLMFPVLFRQNGCHAGGNAVPADTDLRIIPHDTALSCRRPSFGAYKKDVIYTLKDILREYLKRPIQYRHQVMSNADFPQYQLLLLQSDG